jgi:hypothetical protein
VFSLVTLAFMATFVQVKTELMFKEPIVDITHGKCSGTKVTITDHYGMLFHFKHTPGMAEKPMASVI